MAGKLTKSGDVYAFGVVTWGLCLGKLPWHGLRAMQIIMQVTMLRKTLQVPDELPEGIKVLALR